MRKDLSVSIIIPVYNEENYLARCLDAIALQSVKPDEVIVIDNNSTDKTTEIAKSYDFVKVLHEKIQGVQYARTRGFDSAVSEIIGRIDADSILPREWVARVKDGFADKTVAALTGPVRFHDMPFSKINYRLDDFIRKALILHDKEYPLLFGSNMAIRNSDWHKIRSKLCDRRDIHEDMDLGIHLFLNNMRIKYDSQFIGSMSSRRLDDSWSDFRSYSKYMKRTYASHGLHGLGPDFAALSYMAGYVLMWPVRRSYDTKSNKRTIRQLIKNDKRARKHPMSE